MKINKPPTSKKTTSICLNMIVKNEAHIITETFDNLLKYIPLTYWVISDTGSTDGTQQLIKDYFKSKNIDGELFQDEWHDFGYNRTLALKHANKKTDYLFIFDADDSIHGDFILPEPQLFNKNMYNLKFGGDRVSYVRPLLINNNLEWKFNGVLHEFLTCVTNSVEGVLLDGNYYVESGRKGSRSKDPEKYKKDAEILKRAYYVDLEKPDKGLSNRYAFYCAQSYKDCGMVDDAIEWYKMVADKINTWVQERYYSCFVLGDLYARKNDFENSIRYLTKSIIFDHERIEGVALACEHLLQKDMHLLCCSLGEQYLGHMTPPVDKLFLFEPFYFNHVEYSCSIAGFHCGKLDLGYQCCKKIIITRCIDNIDKYIKTCINLAFYKDQLNHDNTDTLEFFYEYNETIQKLLRDGMDVDQRMHECWNILFEKNRAKLTELPKNSKTLFNKKQMIHATNRATNRATNHAIISDKSANNDKVFISFTTCKRVDLFKQTMGSILNHWTDKEKIDYWFCVDDNSSRKDREFMQTSFPWITYYMKTEAEKGHRESMNIIWNKLQEIKPKYWIHMEDDFLFYTKRNYVEDSIAVLKKYNTSNNIRQVLYNRNYSETIEHSSTKGHVVLSSSEQIPEIPVVFHNHNTTDKFFFQNCCYWPDYSFRPSMIDVETILELGNYNTENQFFELDYANRWYNAGYRSAFFNMISCRHIGRLTSDRHDKTKPNSYELNNTSQFNLTNSFESHPSVASHDFNTDANTIVTNESMRKLYSPPTKVTTSSIIKIVNLKHRNDRKKIMIERLVDRGFSESEYEFVDAVYGKELSSSSSSHAMELYKLFEGNDFGSRCGFIGCALSHYGLWLELLKDTKNDYYIIMEDDVILCDGYKQHITDMENHFKEKDILYHGYTMFKDNREKTREIYDYAFSMLHNETQKTVSIHPLNKSIYIGGIFGYSINKSGAQKLVDYIHKHGIKHGIDYVMKIVNTLECYETQPNLCISLWNEENTDYDTDIQKYHDSFDFSIYENNYLEFIKNNFIFVKTLDQIGFDLYHKQNNLKTMTMQAVDDKKCVAFNTLGFFKSDVVNLTKSPWFGDTDGIYIKKEYAEYANKLRGQPGGDEILSELVKHEKLQKGEINVNSGINEISNVYNISKINEKNTVKTVKTIKRIKMLCNWCSSRDVCLEFLTMYKDGNFKEWSNIEITWENTNIDYYVIINMPFKEEYYDPEKTIVFQMEPWVYDNTKNWGVKTWGEWANPDPIKFMKVFRHTESLNNVQWQVSPPSPVICPGGDGDGDILNKIMCTISYKIHDEGHEKRVNFLKRIDLLRLDIIHVYGRENYHGLKSYVGVTDNKRELSKYKYCFSCENNSEKNYATEKIWEPILFECLCFYWGCPNLEEYIDSRAFVRLPLDDFDGCVSIITKAIEEDWWAQRIDVIKKEKQKILNELGFFPRLNKIINDI